MKTTVSHEHAFVQLAMANLTTASPTSTPEDQAREATAFMVEMLSRLVAFTENGGDPATFWEEFVIAPTIAQALCDWQPYGIAQWGLVVLMCRDAIVHCGLEARAIKMVRVVAAHDDVYESSAMCALFASIADTYAIRITPRVYAKGLQTLPLAA